MKEGGTYLLLLAEYGLKQALLSPRGSPGQHMVNPKDSGPGIYDIVACWLLESPVTPSRVCWPRKFYTIPHCPRRSTSKQKSFISIHSCKCCIYNNKALDYIKNTPVSKMRYHNLVKLAANDSIHETPNWHHKIKCLSLAMCVERLVAMMPETVNSWELEEVIGMYPMKK